MFDLFTGKVQHVPSTPAIPILISTGVQGTALAVIVVASFLVATRELPPVPDVLAFIAELPTVAPPPPPPPPAPAPSQPQVASLRAVPMSPLAAPIEAPAQIEPEAPAAATSIDAGVPGGVEGGIASGIVGSIPAILEGPPPPVSHEPVRIGGQVQAPALVKRVEPIYPFIAQHASIDGIVILDAIVDERGRVKSLKVLRGHPLLARAATEAVEQWLYEPLRLNGTPTAFELTVSLWFHFDDKPKRPS
jgi:periplasmic protein TonB